MIKQDFKTNGFVELLKERHVDLSQEIPATRGPKLDIDPDAWYEYIQENFYEAFTVYWSPRDFLDDDSNLQMSLTRELGLNQGNTMKYDWGRTKEQNSDLKNLLGDTNIRKLGFDPDTTLVRLLCYTPGNCLPIHKDGYEGWRKMFNKPDVMPDRYSVMVSPWRWGHFLQLHDAMLANWNSGDTWIVPNDVWHCSGNCGILPKVTLTVTGEKQ